jgi:hypothetical protein
MAAQAGATGGYAACERNWKRGWWCSRTAHHNGPCALRPRWWNLRWFR